LKKVRIKINAKLMPKLNVSDTLEHLFQNSTYLALLHAS